MIIDGHYREYATPEEIAAAIREADYWDIDLCRRLCEFAGLEEEWNAADDSGFESVIFRAADILGVEIV